MAAERNPCLLRDRSRDLGPLCGRGRIAGADDAVALKGMGLRLAELLERAAGDSWCVVEECPCVLLLRAVENVIGVA
jgi:hypothetical protein